VIDFSIIKNKSIVTISYQHKDIDCEVVAETPSACTVTLPDGSITTVGKMHVLAVKNAPTPKPTTDKE
jgi:hypothetical protein